MLRCRWLPSGTHSKKLSSKPGCKHSKLRDSNIQRAGDNNPAPTLLDQCDDPERRAGQEPETEASGGMARHSELGAHGLLRMDGERAQ